MKKPKIPQSPILPAGRRLVVKHFDRTTITAGGLLLEEKHRDDANHGTILAIGPEVTVKFRGSDNKQREPQVGDVIAYNKPAALRIRNGEEEYFIIFELDVFGLVPDPKINTPEFSGGRYQIKKKE